MRTTKLSERRASIRPSSPSTAWWRAPWRHTGRRRSRPRRSCRRDYTRFQASEPRTLSEAERARIRQLAADIPALWKAPTTTPAERQAIVRQLLERVIVTIIDDSEHVGVEVHWVGGHRTRTHLVRPVARLEQLSYYPALVARVLALHEAGRRCPQIAAQLNAEGWRPAKRRATFNGPMVANLLAHQGVPAGVSHTPSAPWPERDPHEWSLPELARTLEMPLSDAVQLAAQGLAAGPPGAACRLTAVADLGRRRRA